MSAPRAGDRQCFACGRPMWGGVLVDTRDDQTVYVGRDCARHVAEAGETGYQPPLGGPRPYPLPEAPNHA